MSSDSKRTTARFGLLISLSKSCNQPEEMIWNSQTPGAGLISSTFPSSRRYHSTALFRSVTGRPTVSLDLCHDTKAFYMLNENKMSCRWQKHAWQRIDGFEMNVKLNITAGRGLFHRLIRCLSGGVSDAPGRVPLISTSVEICRHEKVISGAKERVTQWHRCDLPRTQQGSASMSRELVDGVPYPM